ncbi:hypothetical protein DFR76_104664 [Nocardia pseudobrasiliensis]|uniref:ANTAR domain-containing protein n=2 Tax=Nocardia pseudobrasiliensis TaxID=45979 RepID=A0A370I9W5_9NOCA|nr:hypothetical protein DFR76_104664 [Nocardia pseudobrasiliensis]
MGNAATTRFLAVLNETESNGASSGQRLCQACVRSLPVSEAAITLAMPGGRWEVLGAVGETAARFADAQAATGEGPGPDAHRFGTPIRVADFAQEAHSDRWPLLAQWNRVGVIGSECSIPLRLGAFRLGFLDLLGVESVLSDAVVYSEALQVAGVITTMLLTDLTALSDVRADGDGIALAPWGEPSASAREIHQAIGMIAVQLDCTVTAAYARLVGYTFTTERTLADVAADVVARRLRFPPDPEPGALRRHQPDPT